MEDHRQAQHHKCNGLSILRTCTETSRHHWLHSISCCKLTILRQPSAMRAPDCGPSSNQLRKWPYASRPAFRPVRHRDQEVHLNTRLFPDPSHDSQGIFPSSLGRFYALEPPALPRKSSYISREPSPSRAKIWTLGLTYDRRMLRYMSLDNI